jgi:hypothetical protein
MPVTRPTCSTCPFWYDPNLANPQGDCRRRAPDVINPGTKAAWGWPQTNPGDWCGEHPQFLIFMRENNLGQVPMIASSAPPVPPPPAVKHEPPQQFGVTLPPGGKHHATHKNKR